MCFSLHLDFMNQTRCLTNYFVKFNLRYRYHGPYVALYSIYFTGGLTRGPKYNNQTFLNLKISPQYRKRYSFFL